MPTLHPCAACGRLVHDAPHGSGVACPVCGWIDDFEQLVHPDLVYGANTGTSLRQAQARLRDTPPGAAPDRAAAFAHDPGWRPLRTDEHPPPDPDGPSSPVCDLGAPDPVDFVPYWRR